MRSFHETSTNTCLLSDLTEKGHPNFARTIITKKETKKTLFNKWYEFTSADSYFRLCSPQGKGIVDSGNDVDGGCGHGQ